MLITVDTETTGFTPKQGHKIVEVGAVLYKDGVEIDTFHSLVWPERDIPYQAQKAHGLGTRQLRGAPTFREIAADLSAFLQRADRWAHNAPFDQRFLDAEFQANGVVSPKLTCSLKALRQSSLKRSSDKLDVLAPELGWVFGGRGAHSALEDARALGHVLPFIFNPEGPIQQQPFQGGDATERLLGDVSNVHFFNRGKGWTPKDDLQLQTLWKDGAGVRDLCPRMGRTPKAIAMRLAKLGVISHHPWS